MREFLCEKSDRMGNILAESGFAVQVKSCSGKSRAGYINAELSY
jgi:hypothetical protein